LVLWRKPVDPLLRSLLAAVDVISAKLRPGRPSLTPLFAGPWLALFAEWAGPLEGVIY
jgi:hypothetical protein